jgi:hypothetical protein
MASQEPYPLATIGVDPITSVGSLPDRPPPPKPVAGKSAAQKFIDRLLGIEGEKRYQTWPERLGRDQVIEPLKAGARFMRNVEEGGYGQPGTHEFTEAVTPDAFRAAATNYYPGEMAAFHASGKLSPLELSSNLDQKSIHDFPLGFPDKKAVKALEPPLGDLASRAAGNEPAAAIPKLPETKAEETLHTLSAELGKDDIEALKSFTGGGAWAANAHILGKQSFTWGDKTSAEALELFPKLDAALAKGTVNQNITVYRGMKNVDLSSLKPFVGTDVPFHMPTYSSTSLDPRVAAGFASGKKGALWKITVPKGAKALDMRKHTHYPSEKEVVLPRGSRWKITKIEQHPQGKVPVIHAEVIP